MGLLDLMRTMSIQQQRQPERQAQARNGLTASRTKRKGSPCQGDVDSQGAGIEIYSGPSLPEDVWCHIHSFMPMRDAARAACVSRAFLRSWRCHPNLTFNNQSLGLNKNACGNDQISMDFVSIVDCILKKHSGIGVKTLKIEKFNDCNSKDFCYLNSWLQIAVTPGIEELTLKVPMVAKYNFPYSLLSNGSVDSIRYLLLYGCSFCPTVGHGWLRSLTRLHLWSVRITGDELGCLLSNSFALERLETMDCNRIVCLKVPCMLQRLSYLQVLCCERLQMIDNKAPNISSFSFTGDSNVQLSLGETLQMKSLGMSFSGAVRYARAELPSSMPNLESLTIYSSREIASAPMLHSKFLHLKNLRIEIVFSPPYDFFSLVSFFDACPSLETFVLDASQHDMKHVSILTDPSYLRQMREQHHHNLKSVKILGFSSAKSLVELACHVVESITSLECLTLETSQNNQKCSELENKYDKCSPLQMEVLLEAQRALLAIRTFIEPKVPSTVKFHVVEPCSRCHSVEH